MVTEEQYVKDLVKIFPSSKMSEAIDMYACSCKKTALSPGVRYQKIPEPVITSSKSYHKKGSNPSYTFFLYNNKLKRPG